jgi:hypothetical protein
VKSTRIKIFQDANYKKIETMYTEWAEEREAELRQRDNKDVQEHLDMLQIPPTVLMSFDQSLQKYILTVTYSEIVPD